MKVFATRTAARIGVLATLLAGGTASAQQIEIPEASDWTDHGVVIVAGTGWDRRLGGAISPCWVVKKNGTIYLYYLGADGDRSTDGGPRNRALGVATSTDGISFTKYSGNPIITFLPHDNEEEGVFSAGGILDDNGDFIIYYGALEASNSTSEEVDIYVALATSSDGLSFDNSRALNGEFVFEPDGDEVDPIGVLRDGDTWHVYYINNAGWELNLLSGPAMDNLSDQGGVSGTPGGEAKGGGNPIFLDDDTFVVFFDHFDSRDPIVVTGSRSDPSNLTQVDRYDWGGEGHKNQTTFLDRQAGTWYMYYRSDNTETINVKTAPMVGGEPVAVPNPPTDLKVEE